MSLFEILIPCPYLYTCYFLLTNITNLAHRSTRVSLNLLYNHTFKHEGVSNASYMGFSTHVNVSMFEVKIPLKHNMRMKLNEVD